MGYEKKPFYKKEFRKQGNEEVRKSFLEIRNFEN